MGSPNVRLERATKKQFDRLHDWSVDELDVGKRSVTFDILAAAMVQVCEQNPQALLAAIREQWAHRAKEE